MKEKIQGEDSLKEYLRGRGQVYNPTSQQVFYRPALRSDRFFLTGTDKVKARMRGKATVVRIDASTNSGIGEKTPRMDIAVKLDSPLHLETVDVKTQGNQGEPPENLK